jgi:hypothetical protein
MASERTINAIPKDTDIEVFAKYLKIQSRLSIEEKSRIVTELNENMRSLLKTGIKMQHPEFTDRQVTCEVIRRVYGVNVEKRPDANPK